MASYTQVEQYKVLSKIYNDIAVNNFSYPNWCEYVLSTYKYIFMRKAESFIDVATGTGLFAREFVKNRLHGYASDISLEMLEQARSNLSDYTEIQIYQANLTDPLPNVKVDIVSAINDSVNYLPSINQLGVFLKNSKDALSNNGLLVFDMSSPYYLSNFSSLQKQQKIEIDNYSLQISSHFRRNELTITFRLRDKGASVQYIEHHRQYAYSLKQIRQAINASGLKLLKLKGGIDDSDYTDRSKTWIFFCG